MSQKILGRIGWALTGLFSLFLAIASAAPKLVQADVATQSMRDLGWDPGYTLGLGLLELGCLILHLWPRTALLGAILMTGLLGGAIATQLRADMPLFSHILFGTYLGLFMWGGYWLRTPAFRAIFPVRQG